MAANGDLFYPAEHNGFIAGDWEGLITYRLGDGRCEVTLVMALRQGEGIGSALLDATAARARADDCTDLWLISTNDNLDALEWYRRKGFTVTAVREGAVDRSRETLKSSIPTHNRNNGLPICDEIELSLAL
jgi:GNAT superfamily N-acetyltransferase